MSTYTKEQLIARINQVTAINKYRISRDPGADGLAMDNELLAIALASLEAEPVAYVSQSNLDALKRGHNDVFVKRTDDVARPVALYTAPPALVEPAEWQQWIADAVEYLEGGLEADGELEAEGSIEAKRLLSRRAAMLQGAGGNSPVIPDGWVACSERMPDIGTEIFYFCQGDDLRDCGIVSSSNFSGRGDAQLYVNADGYDLRFGVDITHWMPLPAAPQQNVKQALAKGMERYSDAMQKLADGGD